MSKRGRPKTTTENALAANTARQNCTPKICTAQSADETTNLKSSMKLELEIGKKRKGRLKNNIVQPYTKQFQLQQNKQFMKSINWIKKCNLRSRRMYNFSQTRQTDDDVSESLKQIKSRFQRFVCEFRYVPHRSSTLNTAHIINAEMDNSQSYSTKS